MTANANPTLSDALQNACMIVTVNTSALGLTRLDKRASAESDDAHNAVRGAARVIVSRLPGVESDHRDLIAVQNDTRAFTYGCTAPWGVKTSDGRRIMANNMFEKWIGGFAARHEIFMRKREVMLAKAPDMIAEAERNRGQFDVRPPTLDELRNAYDMSYTLEPIADASCFGPMGQQVDVFLKQQYDINVAASFRAGQVDRVEAARPLVERVVERMKAFQERETLIADGKDPGREGVFRDTLVSNVQEMCGLLDSLNVTADAGLHAIVQDLRAFDAMSAKELRKSPQMRATAVTVAAQAVDAIDRWLTGAP